MDDMDYLFATLIRRHTVFRNTARAEEGSFDRTRGGKYDSGVQPDYEKYIKHTKDVADWWRAGFQEFGLPFRVNTKGVCREERMLSLRHVGRFVAGEERGVWHENQIHTACEAIARQLAYPGVNICVNGSTQVGKTGTLHACLVGSILRYLSTGNALRTSSSCRTKKASLSSRGRSGVLQWSCTGI